MLSTKQLCRHLANIIRVPIRLFDAQNELMDIGFAEGNQDDPLVSDPEFRDSLISMKKEGKAVFFYEGNSVIYSVIDAGENTVIAGPACYSLDNKADSRATALLHGIRNEELYVITPVPLNTFIEVTLTILNSTTSKEMSRADLMLDGNPQAFTVGAGRDAYRIVYDHRENSTSHNSYAQERREQKAIREGNIEALKRSWDEVQTGQVGRLGNDVLTHYRNLGVVIITLASRSAMEGGVLPEVAFSLADSYTLRLNEMDEPAEIGKMIRSAELHFAELVRDLTHRKSNNLYVYRCKELVHDRLHEPIFAEELAEELGITRSYLSQLFIKEEGVHLSEYILREKIRASEYLLMYPDIPLGRIAATFGFSSQSHYGQVFRKYQGNDTRKVPRSPYNREVAGSIITHMTHKAPGGAFLWLPGKECSKNMRGIQ